MPASLPRRRKKLDLHCNICGKRYTKREHLQRHARIHTGDKPFPCLVCGRCFARQDVLNRHSRVHLGESNCEAKESPQDAQGATPGQDEISLEDCSSLLWPDAEGLLHDILSIDPGFWDQPAPLMPQTLAVVPTPVESIPNVPGISPSNSSTIVEDGERAIQSLSGMIGETLCSATAPTALSGLTSRFLDSSLHMFFKNFVPMFPIIHQPTFVFRHCPPPLLLNAIALGALFLGTSDAITKADALWQLAHTAVATSWHSMIAHRRAYDSCNGVHLAQTVLLSQIYAALSNNKILRMTSQVFHGLAIFWASHCGMYEMLEEAPLPSPDAHPETISHAWHSWIARETRLRTVLGLYVVDGVVSQFSGNPTFARHMANPLKLPSDESTFNAASAEDWVRLSHINHPISTKGIRLCDVFHALFADESSPFGTTVIPHYGISLFHHKITLEGIRSLVADANRTYPSPVGVPCKSEIIKAVNRLREQILQDKSLSSADQVVALLQWHSICLDLVASTARGTRRMCYMHGIPQQIFGGDSRDEQDIDPRRWSQSKAARIALLHASQLQELATRLPLGIAYDINVPGAVFAAATTYSAFALAGAGKVILPLTVDWEATVQAGVEELHLITGDCDSITQTLGFIEGVPPSRGLPRDLSYELISIRNLLRGISLQWSVAQEMEQVVGAWIERCQGTK